MSDGLNGSTASSRVRKSRRLIERLRSRQPSKSDILEQTGGAIDPIKELRVAQDPDEGETQNRDRTTADVGEYQQRM